MSEIGVMVCGHGSRDEGACTEFARVVGKLRQRLAPWPVEMGYLEFATPVIREGLDRLRAKGVKRVIALPGMLFAAGHVKNDVPSVLNAYAKEHGITIEMGRDLGIDAMLLEAARDRIEAALAEAPDFPREKTLLAVIGRGTSDSDANGNVHKVARMLMEGMGFAHVEVGFSGVAHPRVDVALERAVRLGFERIVVFPWFLFTGVLIRRIHDQADAVAAAHPDVAFVKAGYLNDHPRVVDTFAARARGVLEGDVNMNCSLCKYRVQILGYEDDQGAVQEGHHHHVEGIGTDGHSHHTAHSHSHSHTRHGHAHSHSHVHHGHSHSHSQATSHARTHKPANDPKREPV